MGIAHLITFLHPYGKLATLGCSGKDCRQHRNLRCKQIRVIIDGPGLAYHVYYRLLAHTPCNPDIDAAPTYREIGWAFRAFLDTLRAHHVLIEKIYFDGYLPVEKRNIRRLRLESSLKQMVTLRSTNREFRTSNRQSSPCDLDHSSDGVAWLFNSSKPIDSKLRGLPAAPFLVPAVLDTLRYSEYSSLTCVVAGEADSFCAAAARNGEFIILTGDSDLLVYDLGPNSAVVLFHQIVLKLHQHEITPASLNCGVIEAWLLPPREIALRLGHSSLLRLAFEITEEPTITFSEALRRSKEPSKKQSSLENFTNGYTRTCLVDGLLTNTAAARMDPRISEFVLQITSDSPDPVQIYLPFLIDDPSRASAWAVGKSNRVLAYSCINYTLVDRDQGRRVSEFGRKGSRIMPADISMIAQHACILQAENVMAQLEFVRDIISWETSDTTWRLLGVLNVYKWYIDNNKHAPSRKACAGLIDTTSSRTLTWEEIHLFAQLDAYMYSLRALKQILRYASLLAETRMPTPLLRLEKQLRGLPSLDELLLSRRELSRQNLSKVPSESVIDTLLSSLDTETVQRVDGVDGRHEENITCDTGKLPETHDGRQCGKGGRGRKERPKMDPNTASRRSPALNNRYSILANP